MRYILTPDSTYAIQAVAKFLDGSTRPILTYTAGTQACPLGSYQGNGSNSSRSKPPWSRYSFRWSHSVVSGDGQWCCWPSRKERLERYAALQMKRCSKWAFSALIIRCADKSNGSSFSFFLALTKQLSALRAKDTEPTQNRNQIFGLKVMSFGKLGCSWSYFHLWWFNLRPKQQSCSPCHLIL